MTLKSIVSALGGELYAGGRRANIPAPGHSAADRSVSLLLADGRVIIHGFGGADWRAARDDLVRHGFLERDGRLRDGGNPRQPPAPPRPDNRLRQLTAERLWGEGLTLTPGQASGRHLIRRGVPGGLSALNLRHHPGAPLSVYRERSSTRPALIAGVVTPQGRLTAVELTYLGISGGLALDLKLPRKSVGLLPPGSAVRLAEAAETLLVAEGVMTTLSAMAWFALPGWALMAVRNLEAWSPPPMVRRVVIAGDRGAAGEAAAERLRGRLCGQGLNAEVRLPGAAFGDWNEAVVAHQRTKEGRGGAPERRG